MSKDVTACKRRWALAKYPNFASKGAHQCSLNNKKRIKDLILKKEILVAFSKPNPSSMISPRSVGVIALGGEDAAPGVSYLCAAVFASSTPAPCIHVRTAFMPAPMGSSFKVLPLLWMLSWIPNMKTGTLTLPSRRCAIPFSGAHLPCVKEREGEIWQLSAQVEKSLETSTDPVVSKREKRPQGMWKQDAVFPNVPSVYW